MYTEGVKSDFMYIILVPLFPWQAHILCSGVATLIPARSHTFVEIDHEIISTVILLPSAESFMKGCCQLQAKVCARLLVNCLFKLAQEKSVVRETDRPAMTIAVDLGRKATKQTNKQIYCVQLAVSFPLNYLENNCSEKEPTKLENARFFSFVPHHNNTCLLGL